MSVFNHINRHTICWNWSFVRNGCIFLAKSIASCFILQSNESLSARQFPQNTNVIIQNINVAISLVATPKGGEGVAQEPLINVDLFLFYFLLVYELLYYLWSMKIIINNNYFISKSSIVHACSLHE